MSDQINTRKLKTVYDLKPLEMVKTHSYGLAQFIGFIGEGFECQIGTWQKTPSGGRKPINPIVPVAELIVLDEA